MRARAHTFIIEPFDVKLLENDETFKLVLSQIFFFFFFFFVIHKKGEEENLHSNYDLMGKIITFMA